jgi:hypothetical protein
MSQYNFKLNLILLIILTISHSASAQSNKITIPLNANFDPISGIAFLMSESGTKSIFPVDINKTNNKVEVSFSVEEKLTKNNVFVNAAVFSSDGQVVVSKTISLSRAQLADLKKCADNKKVAIDNQNEIGVLQSLVSIRQTRKDTALAKIKQLMTPELLLKLSKLESGLGLQTTPELSSDMSPLVLRDRLYLLLQALKNYRSSSTKTDKTKSAK